MAASVNLPVGKYYFFFFLPSFWFGILFPGADFHQIAPLPPPLQPIKGNGAEVKIVT